MPSYIGSRKTSMKTQIETVRQILTERPATRNNDILLMVEFCQRTGLSTDLKDHVESNTNWLESIRRARQMVQKTNPMLRANNIMDERRKQNESEVRTWVRENI